MKNPIRLETVSVSQLPYGRDLNLILGYLKLVFPQFPNRICEDASRLVTKVTGLRTIAGYFDEMPYDGKVDWHAWNYDPKRKLFVDLTANQFNENLPEILITTKDDDRFIFKPGNTRDTRQRCFNYCETSFLKDYYRYTQNPSGFFLKDGKKIIRDHRPISLEEAALCL